MCVCVCVCVCVECVCRVNEVCTCVCVCIMFGVVPPRAKMRTDAHCTFLISKLSASDPSPNPHPLHHTCTQPSLSTPAPYTVVLHHLILRVYVGIALQQLLRHFQVPVECRPH